MARYAQHMFQLQQDTQCTIAGQHCRLGAYVREIKSLKWEIEHIGQEHGALCQQLRALESRIRDMDQELFTIYRRLTERDQELLRHRSLLREAEEATIAKARGLEDLQVDRAQEIEDLQEREELQEQEIELMNRDNEIANPVNPRFSNPYDYVNHVFKRP
jgi:chromosome segregation ATPase